MWIEGLEEAKWGGFGPQQDTVIGSLNAVMQVLGEEGVTYDYLMGMSGSAFRLQITQPKWGLAAPYATNGFDCSEVAAKALGYRLTWFGAEKDDAAAVRKRTEAVIQSIDGGYPALFSGAECSVIVGYIDGGKQFLVRTNGAREKGYTTLGEWTWQRAGILNPADGAPTRSENLRTSLRLAAELARMEHIGDFACGFRAYGLWAEQLEDDARFEDEGSPDSSGGYCYPNGYMYCVLDAARDSAARYLNLVSGESEGRAARHLAKAAGLYAKVVETFRTKRHDLPEPWNLFPWDLDGGKNWTREMRHTQARVLREALALERQAIAEIEGALNALQ